MRTFDDVLASLCIANDYEPRPYSGRGMFGQQCLAIYTSEHPCAVGAKLMRAAYEVEGGWALDLVRLLESTHEDSIGAGRRVFFWPSVAWKWGGKP